MARLDPAALDALVHDIAAELEPRLDVTCAYLYGSVLGDAGFRDVDVAIWTAPGAPPDIDIDVGRALSRRTGLPVDVRRVNEAPGSFVFHVLRGRPVVVRNERFLADLIERTAREYHDLAPLRLRAVREAFAA